MTSKKNLWILVVVFVGLILFSQTVNSYLMINTDLMDVMMLPLKKQHTYYIPGAMVLLIIILLENACWVLPVGVYFMITSAITNSFKNLNNEIEKSVQTTKGSREAPLPGTMYPPFANHIHLHQ